MKKFSIITVVLNRANSILSSIESLKCQDYPSDLVEHIVIDGGSTDGTLEILKKHLGNNAILISEKDNGIYDALNKGIKLASGNIIGVLHSDDFYSHNSVISKVAERFSSPGIDIVYGDLDYVNSTNVSDVIRHWHAGIFLPERLVWGWMPPHPTFFVKRSIINEIGGFDEQYRISADYDFMLKCLIQAVKIEYVNDVLVKMRSGGLSNGSLPQIFKKMYEDLKVIRNNHIGGIGTLIFKNLSKITQFINR